MVLLIHIVFAITALSISTISLFSPSRTKIIATYALTLATLLSAAGLVIFENASIGRTCLTAFVYLAIIAVNMFVTKKKLASVSA